MSKPLFDPENPNIVIYDRLDSTSQEAKRMISSGYAEHGLIVWTKQQLNGYGRYGREWESGSHNLTFSVVIENERKAELVAVYPFIAALAIRKSLEKHLTESELKKIRFKWPNDILFDGKKVGGVIFESEIKDGKINNIVCGIGINTVSFPNGFNFATSLKEEGINDVKIDELLLSIVINFDNYLSSAEDTGDQKIYDEWLKYAYNLGKDIIVITNKQETRGTFVGIKEGNLIVKDQDNIDQVFYTGDVFFSEKEKITAVFGNFNVSNVTLLKSQKK